MDAGRVVVQPGLLSLLFLLLLVVVSRMRALEGWLRDETGEAVTSRSARNGGRNACVKDMLDFFSRKKTRAAGSVSI